MEIKLHKLNNKLCYYQRCSENEDLTYQLDEILRINRHEEEVEYNGEKFKVSKYDHRLQSDENYVYLPTTLIGFLESRVKSIGFTFDVSELNLVPIALDIESKVDFLSKIYNENTDKICDLLSVISANRCGLINLFTGWGKTWAILGLAYAYVTDYAEGKVCILAQGSAVVNEIKSRLPLFQIPQDRVIIENTASVRSQRFYADWWKDSRESIDLVIIDECDSITDTLMNFLNILPNYRFIFGFTATPDAYGGQFLGTDVDLSWIRGSIYRILQYVGTEIVNEIPRESIKLVVIDSHFSDKSVYMENQFKKFKDAIDRVINSRKFIEVLTYVANHAKDTIYLPINNKNLINKVIKNAKKWNPDLNFIYWDANSIWTTDGISFRNHVELNKWLRSTPSDKRSNIIISTRASYRGISLPSLTDILLIENSNYRNIIQSIGRCMRSDYPTVWVPRETDKDKNLLFFCMATKRLKIINQSYPNLTREMINL